jgi:hypothetical protein
VITLSYTLYNANIVELESVSVGVAEAIREVQVEATSGKKPIVVQRLAEWEYLERSLHRMLAGWGRSFVEWNDKVAVCQHIWETSECVRRVRERLLQFPGTKSNLDLSVSVKLETLVNTVILAPSVEDAIDGIYQFMTGAMAKAYIYYLEVAHPVHDAPTFSLIAENVRMKEQFRLWYQERRRRVPHIGNELYLAAMQAALNECDDLKVPLTVEEEAQPVGVRTNFRPVAIPPHPVGSTEKPTIMPYLWKEFQTNVEIRRLYWCYGYMREMNVAEDQLLWIYDGWHLPWEFLQDVSRHTWDESRHGDSGHSRLLDFGITIQEIGFDRYQKNSLNPDYDPENPLADSKEMSPRDLYDALHFIGMVAETGYFTVKHEAYADMRDGGDLESAEMVLFDIIDETSHVQYAHRWLPVMEERLGIPEDTFKRTGAIKRRECEEQVEKQMQEYRQLPNEGELYDLVQGYLRRLREQKPLTNVETCPPRNMVPM